jgi:hypothetical protein
MTNMLGCPIADRTRRALRRCGRMVGARIALTAPGLRGIWTAAVALAICSAPLASQSSVQVEEIGSIGVASSPDEEVFGDIASLAVDPERGTLFLFDRLSFRLSAFSRSGRFQAAVGRHGSGPREFRSPARLTFHEGLVYATDALNGRISAWELSGDSLRLVDLSRTLFPLEGDLCNAGGTLVHARFNEGGLFQKLEWDGSVRGSFGTSLISVPGLNPRALSIRMACDQRSGSVFVSALGILRKYDVGTETLRWEVRIPGIVPPEVTADPRTGLPRFSRPRGADVQGLVSVIVAPGDRVLVQYSVNPPTGMFFSNSHITDVETVVFAANDGRVLERRSDLPRLDATHGDRVFSMMDDPFPIVRIYRWR